VVIEMNGKREIKIFAFILVVFGVCYFLPMDSERFRGAVLESLALVRWYAREHVILCLVPAFFIAGAVGVFVSQAAVMKFLGAKANRIMAYGVASLSGTILAVCSCTVLPLFAGIYTRGAGLGPATAFLYSGPAINILAIILTARVLGLELGIARAVGAIIFSVVIGLLMHLIFRREEQERAKGELVLPDEDEGHPLWQTGVYFALMVGVLVMANWGRPDGDSGLWHAIWSLKWPMTALLSALLGVVLVLWFGLRWWHFAAIGLPTAIVALSLPQHPTAAFAVGVAGLSLFLARTPGESQEWLGKTWEFAKLILPLLFIGVVAAGFFLGTPAMDGRPAGEGIIPPAWVANLVGGNSLWANLFASIVGAFMYFATLTEVPILEGLLGAGMGKGPALALLLAGPALSLPNMLVIRSILGTKKTAVFVALVTLMAMLTGMVFGFVSADP
jgi:uncharacterized protein